MMHENEFKELLRRIEENFPEESQGFINMLNTGGPLKKYLLDSDFFTAPASTKYHLSKHGGLYEHSFHVMCELVDLTDRNYLTWERPESPYIVGLFHDLCKVDQYKPKESTGKLYYPSENEDDIYELTPVYEGFEYNNEILLKGHGEKSVMILANLMRLTKEEVACIRYHMGAFNDSTYDWNDYTRAIHKYPNVLWTHHADMIAAHILEVE